MRGYQNKAKRHVNVTPAEKRAVRRLRRRALRRELRGEHIRKEAVRATRWGHWYGS